MSNTKVRSILADQCDISADSKGNCSLSIRGAAELLGVTKTPVVKQLAVIRSTAGLLKTTEPNDGGKNAGLLNVFPESDSINDFEFSKLIQWYAFLSPRGKTKEAQALASLVFDIGVRGWMQAEAGHDGSVQELVQSVKIERSIRENFSRNTDVLPSGLPL